MRKIVLAAALVALAVPAGAQQKPATKDADTPAVTTPDTPRNPAAPVAGANSFTEGQAKSRLEDNGFTNVSDLRKDNNGVWRGKASKGGKAMDVSVDFQGNVTPR
jgi:protein-disulfide isomerase